MARCCYLNMNQWMYFKVNIFATTLLYQCCFPFICLTWRYLFPYKTGCLPESTLETIVSYCPSHKRLCPWRRGPASIGHYSRATSYYCKQRRWRNRLVEREVKRSGQSFFVCSIDSIPWSNIYFLIGWLLS